MNELFQIFLFIIAILYKFLLARQNIFGWILGATSSAFSAIYVLCYLRLPLLMSLELSFLLLSLYGVYKHKRKITYLTKIDYLIITMAIFVIGYLLKMQLQSGTIWYEAGGSVSFLIGVIFMAQKNKISIIIGWLCFINGSLCVGSVMLYKHAYILVLLHVISIGIGIYAILKIYRYNNKNKMVHSL